MTLSASITDDGEYIIVTLKDINDIEKIELPFTVDEVRDIIMLLAESIDAAKQFEAFQKLDSKTKN